MYTFNPVEKVHIKFKLAQQVLVLKFIVVICCIIVLLQLGVS